MSSYIAGYITYDFYERKTKSTKLKIKSINSGNVFDMKIPPHIFCPAKKGDSISAYCNKTYNYGKVVLVPITTPWVEIGVSKRTIIECFIIFLKGNRFGNKSSERLYDRFEELAIRYNEGKQEDSVEKLTVSYINDVAIDYAVDGNGNSYDLLEGYLTKTQFSKLMISWYKKRSLRRLYLLGLNNTEIMSVKDLSLDELHDRCIDNPYKVYQISTLKATSIANITQKQFSEEQMRCGVIIRKVYEWNKNGWTGAPLQKLIYVFPDLAKHMEMLTTEYELILDMKTIYLKYPHIVETSVASYILDNIEEEESDDPAFTSTQITSEQKEAVSKSLRNRIHIITGKPGCGKTFTIKEIIHNLELQNIPYAVASFTGKAVARLKEVLGNDRPSTMHKMISKAFKYRGFEYLILDEVSMITSELFYRFVGKFGLDYSIVLVGDPNQLQTISWGNLFYSIIETNVVPISKLTKNLRVVKNVGQNENGIVINSNRIIEYAEELDPEILPMFKFTQNVNFQIVESNEEGIYDIITKMHNRGILAEDVKIICPYNAPLKEINSRCQQIFNEDEDYITDSAGVEWRVGDIVMIVKNNYSINVMNGEEGIVRGVCTDKQTVYVEFNKKRYEFSINIEKEEFVINTYLENEIVEEVLNTQLLVHAYGITTHKSQGSEWKFVIFYLPEHKANNSFIDRHIVYTAITRAKVAVWCVGDREALERGAVREPRYRCDNLGKRIISNK